MIAGEPLEWPLIQMEVIRAVILITDKRFVNSKDILSHIDNNRMSYPWITGTNKYHPDQITTPRTISSRINTAIKKMAWCQWNTNGCGRTGSIYKVPWVPEDPVIVSIREGRAMSQ